MDFRFDLITVCEISQMLKNPAINIDVICKIENGMCGFENEDVVIALNQHKAKTHD